MDKEKGLFSKFCDKLRAAGVCTSYEYPIMIFPSHEAREEYYKQEPSEDTKAMRKLIKGEYGPFPDFYLSPPGSSDWIYNMPPIKKKNE